MTDGNPTKFGVTEDAKTYLESGDGSFENEDYVGYGHPPKASQWKKAVSRPIQAAGLERMRAGDTFWKRLHIAESR